MLPNRHVIAEHIRKLPCWKCNSSTQLYEIYRRSHNPSYRSGVFHYGFKKRTGHLGQSHFTCCTRDTLSVLKKRFNLRDENRSVLTTTVNLLRKMMCTVAYAGRLTPVVGDIIMMHHDEDTRWYDEQCDCVKSIITFFKLYSDKWKTSLNVSGLSFYPLHVNFMNFYKCMQDFLSIHVHSILAYLPVQLFLYRKAIGEITTT